MIPAADGHEYRRFKRLAYLSLTFAAASTASGQKRADLPPKDQMLNLTVRDVFTYGKVEGSPNEMLSGVRSVAFGPNENLYILDGQNTRVLVIDSTGRYLRTLGRRGNGPGELQMPVGLAITDKEEVAVHELSRRAIIVWSPAGKLLYELHYPMSAGMARSPIGLGTDGFVFQGSRKLSTPERGKSPYVSTLYLISVRNLDRVRPLHSFPDEPGDMGFVRTNDGRVTDRLSVRFGGQPLWAVSRTGAVAATSGNDFLIRVVDLNGGLLGTIAKNIAPRRVTEADIRKWKADQQNRLQRARKGDDVSEVDKAQFAPVMSVVTSIVSDPRGRLWVQRRRADGDPNGPIDLITLSGQYIGTLQAQTMPSAISLSGRAAYVTKDDLGVERVVVRIQTIRK